jgi:hypothetical protein
VRISGAAEATAGIPSASSAVIRETFRVVAIPVGTRRASLAFPKGVGRGAEPLVASGAWLSVTSSPSCSGSRT